MRYYRSFPNGIPLCKAGSSRVTHPSATNFNPEGSPLVRLACVRRAASVRPEPGSNSLNMLYIQSLLSDRTYQSLFLPKLLKVSLTLLYFWNLLK